MTKEILKEEMMNMEQLDNVSGGAIGKPWTPPITSTAKPAWMYKGRK